MKVKLKSGTELDVLFGTDAEFFLTDGLGRIIPASQVVPGLKSKPFKLEHGVCHPDGLSLEVGCPPADTPQGMLANLFKVLDEVKVKYLDPANLTIADTMVACVEDAVAPTKDDLMFGCGSEYDRRSYNMYKESHLNTDDPYRYSGFHIHIGYTNDQPDNWFTYSDASRLVKVLDSLVQKHSLNTTADRATQYGGIGAFRIKPYGIEYRCMDCSVITNPSKFERLVQMLDEIPKAMEGL